MKKTIEKYSIHLILIFATILRVIHIGKRDFWFDEAFTGIAVKQKIPDMMSMIISDVHPPLYYFSAKAFSFFFNYSVSGIRLFSAICGILSIWALYLFTKELANKKVAILTSLAVSISPFAIEYSKEARMYAMLGFLIIMASFFFLRGLKTKKSIYFVLWGIFLGLASLTHYMGIIFSPIFYFVYLGWELTEPDFKFKINFFNFKKILPNLKLIGGYLIACLIFAPWIPIFIKHLSSGNLTWTLPVSLGNIFTDMQIFLFGNPAGEWSSGMPGSNQLHGIADITMFVSVVVFISLMLVFIFKRKRRETLILGIFSLGFMFLVYVINLMGRYYFVSRYLLIASYFLFGMIGLWLSEIKLKFSYAFFAVYLLLIADIAWIHNSAGYNELNKDMSAFQGDNIYFLNSFDYTIGKYYFGADRIILYNIDWPQYNSASWSAIGSSLRKTENFNDLINDKNGLIIYNTAVAWKDRSDKSFDPSKYQLVAKFDDLGIYKSDSYKK